MTRKYIVVEVSVLGDWRMRWCVGQQDPRLGIYRYETIKDVAIFASRSEARRYAARLNARKRGVP